MMCVCHVLTGRKGERKHFLTSCKMQGRLFYCWHVGVTLTCQIGILFSFDGCLCTRVSLFSDVCIHFRCGPIILIEKKWNVMFIVCNCPVNHSPCSMLWLILFLCLFKVQAWNDEQCLVYQIVFVTAMTPHFVHIQWCTDHSVLCLL